MNHVCLTSPRVRFNWGFHDATADKEAKRPNRCYLVKRANRSLGESHPLPEGREWAFYRAGYVAGQACDLGAGRPESSEPAWLEHKRGQIGA